MNTMALLPTEENLIDCLCGNIVNRNIGIRYFYRILQSENGFRSIAIDGKWGSGKTFFVRQTQIVINALNESSNMDEEKRTKVISSIPFSEEEKAPNHSVAMAQNGCEVTCYNRAGHHVSGAEYDKTIEYDGIRQKVVPTIEKKGARDIIRGCHNRDKGTAENERLRDPKFIFSYPKNERLIFLNSRNVAQEEISTMRVG